MVQIENLTKHYDTHARAALNGVTFTLPDRGMVFICGKSGSGKSTLLNLLGGLDSITAGDVIADGNRFSQMSQSDFDDYRNAYVGFVFQDFCLLESMTVFDNVRLALDLKNQKDDGAVHEIIARVGLKGFADRPIKKLSGGQKQRVAVARALVKKPRMILADEPTGNLDSKTAAQILSLLKELSKENLVLVVSHNAADAYTYGDRIIEISDGAVLRDEVRTDEPSSFAVTETEIILPFGGALSDEALEVINAQKATKRITQRKPAFTANRAQEPISPEKDKTPLKSGKLRPRATLKLSFSFLRRRMWSFGLVAVLLSFVVVLLGLCQAFAAYDGKSTLTDAFSSSDIPAFVLKKGAISDDVFKKVKSDDLGIVTDEDLAFFYENGYEGKIYSLINATLGPYGAGTEIGEEVNLNRNYRFFYARSLLGLLECDEAFLNELFGFGGTVKVLAGSLDYTTKPYGMILTDYMADSFLFYAPEYAGTPDAPYQKLVESEMIQNRFAVCAVIDTGYKTRYAPLLDLYGDYLNAETKHERSVAEKALREHELYADFYEELTLYLSISYSLNPSYRQATIEYSNQNRVVGYFLNADILDENGQPLVQDFLMQCDNYSWYKDLYGEDCPVLADDEILLSYGLYNRIFGTSLTPEDTSGFKERTITVSEYPKTRAVGDSPRYSRTYRVVGLTINEGTQSLLSDNEFSFIRAHDVYTFGLYFDSTESCVSFYPDMEQRAFYLGSQRYEAVYEVVEVVRVFKEYFSLIALGLCFVGALLVFSFALGNVRARRYDVGIMKALGGKTAHLSVIFVLHAGIMGLTVSLCTVAGLFALTGIANSLLLEGFETFMKDASLSLLKDAQILSMSPRVLAIDLLLVFAASLLASFAATLAIGALKPMHIIRAKE